MNCRQSGISSGDNVGCPRLYSVLMPMSGVPQFFKFTNWAGISPEDREQRVLNDKRVPDLASYIGENEEDYLFSSVTASYKSEPRFEPYVEGSNRDAYLAAWR
jgi:DNA sulfur modification protein DndB